MKLNEMQQAAADTTSRNVAVIAGPGSGKTQVIVSRVGKLMQAGRRVAVVTLTNSAADEIRLRLQDEPWFCGTIHGLAMRLIGQPGIAVLGEDDGGLLDDEACRRVGYKGTAKAFLAAKDNLLQTGYVTGVPAVTAAVRSWVSMQAEGNVMTFDGVMHFALERLRTAPHHGGLDLVVDEGQDCAAVDFRLFRALNPDSTFIVGDPDQAIFGFRGGDLRSFIAFCNRADSQFRLQVGYRCPASVAQRANQLIWHNRTRIAKGIIPVEDSGCATATIEASTFSAEMGAVFAAKRLADSGERSFAVLCRTNDVVERVRAALGLDNSKERMPHDWSKCRRLLAFLLNPHNDWVAALAASAAFDDENVCELIREARINDTSVAKLVFNELPPATFGEALNWLARYVSQASICYLKQAWPTGLLQSLTAEALIQIDRHSPQPSNCVMTIHKAKGREFDHVWIPCVDDEQYGVSGAGTDRDNREELRRLMFVALTRARRSATVSWCRERESYGGRKEMKPSEMIKEMEESNDC